MKVQAKQQQQAYDALAARYQERIEFLEREAPVEGIVLDDASKEDFWRFIRASQPTSRGDIFLLDNGNFRIVWEGGTGQAAGYKVGLRFIGGGLVRFVISKRRPRAKLYRIYGTIEWQELEELIQGCGLGELVGMAPE